MGLNFLLKPEQIGLWPKTTLATRANLWVFNVASLNT